MLHVSRHRCGRHQDGVPARRRTRRHPGRVAIDAAPTSRRWASCRWRRSCTRSWRRRSASARSFRTPICLGIAGVDRPDDAAVVRGIMKRIGYKARVLVVNDALVALEAGAPGQPGVVIISGTGSISYGRNDSRAGGAVRRMGLRARRRGQRLLDRPRGAARGAARRRPARHGDGADTAAARALRRRPSAGADPRGLSLQPQAGRHRRAGAARPPCVPPGGRGRDRHPARGGATNWNRRRCRSRGGSTSRASRSRSSSPGGIFKAVPWLQRGALPAPAVVAPGSTVRLLDREPAAGAVRLALHEARGGAVVPQYKIH